MKRLTILTHNAFWFQGVPFPTDRPGRPLPGIMEALVEIYRRLGADVLCVQEIRDEETFGRLAAALRMAGGYTPGGVLSQYGGAALWRQGRFLEDSRLQEPRPQRMWQLADVWAGQGPPIRVCNVHLPSSRQLGAGAEGQRLKELSCVIEREVRPGVVLGDFNEPPGGPVCQYMAGKGYSDAAALTGQGFRPTGLGDGRGDYIWVERTLRQALMEYGAMPKHLTAANHAGREYLSDHLPVWITLDPERLAR
jgi:endonuclease/exonuclease/phosphatase family metal-dependent hydrolase